MRILSEIRALLQTRDRHESTNGGAESPSSAGLGAWTALSCGAVLFLGMLGILVALRDYVTDDAYIHLRIARNLVTTGVPAINPEEPVMASSSPLWTLLLALWGVFDLDHLSDGAIVLSALGWSWAIIVWAVVAAKCGVHSRQGIAAGGAWVGGVCAVAAVQQMETPLAMALLGTGVVLTARMPALSAVFLVGAAAIRVELLIFVPLLALALATTRDKLRYWGGAAAFSTPVVGWLWWQFGTIIPHTVVAKRQIYDLRSVDTLVLMAMEHVGRPLFLHYPFLCMVILLVVGGVIVQATLSTAASLRTGQRSFPLAPLVGGGGALIAFFYLLNGVFLFPWYVPLYTVPLGIGISALFARRSFLLRVAVFVGAVPAFLQLGAVGYAALAPAPHFFPDFLQGAKVRTYLSLGAELNRALPGMRLMTAEIGGLGYRYEGEILDGAGLASPRALTFSRSGNERGMFGGIPVGYAQSERPELIVGIERHLDSILQDPLMGEYGIVERDVLLPEDRRRAGDATVMGSEKILVLVRCDQVERLHRGYRALLEGGSKSRRLEVRGCESRP